MTDDLLLLAFLDGELTAEAALAVENRLENEADLRERRDAILALTAALARHLPAAPQVLDQAHRSQVIGNAFDAFTTKKRAYWPSAWQAAAACLLVAVLLGMLIPVVTLVRQKSSVGQRDVPAAPITMLPPTSGSERGKLDYAGRYQPATDGKERRDLDSWYGYELDQKPDQTKEGLSKNGIDKKNIAQGPDLDVPDPKGREEVSDSSVTNFTGDGVFAVIGGSDGRVESEKQTRGVTNEWKMVSEAVSDELNLKLAEVDGGDGRPAPISELDVPADEISREEDVSRGGRAESPVVTTSTMDRAGYVEAAQLVRKESAKPVHKIQEALRARPARKMAAELAERAVEQVSASPVNRRRNNKSERPAYAGWSGDIDLTNQSQNLSMQMAMQESSDGIRVSEALAMLDQSQMQASAQLQSAQEAESEFTEPHVDLGDVDFGAPRGQAILQIARASGLQFRPSPGRVDVIEAEQALDPLDNAGLDPEQFQDAFGTTPFQVIAETAQMTVSITADTASFDASEQRLAVGERVQPSSISAEHFINASPTDYPAPSGNDAFALYAEAGPSPFAAGPHAQHTALLSLGAVARTVSPGERRPLYVTLAIDRSGSMAGAAGIDRVRAGLAELVPHLTADDRVSIVAFADRAELVLAATPGNQTQTILAALEHIETAGGTNAIEGLSLAYQIAAEDAAPGIESRVFLATDGAALAGDGAAIILERIAAQRQRGITLLVMGCGGAHSQDATLNLLATRGDGQYVYAGSDDAARALFRDRLLPERLSILARDAKLQVHWNPERISHARLIGFEQRRLDNDDFRNDLVDAGEIGHDTQVTALFEVIYTESGSGPLGNAVIRFRDTRVDAMQELNCPLPGSLLTNTASPRLRLQASAAQLAELLARSWWANQRMATYAGLEAYLQAQPETPFRNRLLTMSRQAHTLTGEP